MDDEVETLLRETFRSRQHLAGGGRQVELLAGIRAAPPHRLGGKARAALAAAAVGAVVGSTALVAALDTGPSPGPVDRPDDAPRAESVPPGTRLVGVGHAAIAVPEGWATNAIHCGTPTEPTVVVDVTVIPACGWAPPKVFDSVWVGNGANRMFKPSEDFEIDGVAAQRDTTTCGAHFDQIACIGTVFLPSENASFRAEAATKERVEEILSWVHVISDLVAVPGFDSVNMDHQDDDAGEHYRAAIRAAGLGVEVITESRPGYKAGYVLDVSPGPGTMLEPGQVVTMTEITVIVQ